MLESTDWSGLTILTSKTMKTRKPPLNSWNNLKHFVCKIKWTTPEQYINISLEYQNTVDINTILSLLIIVINLSYLAQSNTFSIFNVSSNSTFSGCVLNYLWPRSLFILVLFFWFKVHLSFALSLRLVIAQVLLKWFGHVCRMKTTRIPNQCLNITRPNEWNIAKNVPKNTWKAWVTDDIYPLQ